jgi:leucyl/phenylalanyl-tRNA--protein transferase
MSAPFFLLPNTISFPDPRLALADPNGLLAIGGDLNPERLLEAYRQGIFPWYNENQPILWWSPDPRAVLFLDELKISHSLAKLLKKPTFTITMDRAFNQVVKACAAPRQEIPGTWIQPEMMANYAKLHELGIAHSIEVWQDEKLVGGLYGLSIGQIFCGESMFSLVSNASKVALVELVKLLKQRQFALIDCQMLNPHLMSLGAQEIPRTEFLRILRENRDAPPLKKGAD